MLDKLKQNEDVIWSRITLSIPEQLWSLLLEEKDYVQRCPTCKPRE